ncbi:MAG: site-2 protease family protein [Candidatus Nomurabacteria bacterium]|nr:MAG: site-2 protease family protein [Candidatus Nomurabacteria bacterium]
MELIFGIIVGLIALTFLVVVHELGHAIAARRNGVVVEEFGIGFPPKAWSKKLKNKVEFSLNWLPLGGFVKLQGEYDSADKKGDYGAASFWVKTKILLAGVFINWVTAAVLLTILAFTGLPQVVNNQFTMPGDTKVVPQLVQLSSTKSNYPAAKAGLKQRDKIVRFAGQEVKTTQNFIDMTHQYAGQTVEVIYNRGGSEKITQVHLRKGSGVVFGASIVQPTETQSTWSAPIVGVATTGQLTWETLKGLGQLVGGLANGIVLQLTGNDHAKKIGSEEVAAAGDSVAGPIGILGVIFPAAQQAGLTQLIMLIAVISIALAVMNVLPIPALDGGRWFTMTAFRVLRKPLTKEREERIQTIGFATLMVLVVLVTVADVGKIIK